jgi:hypothetical protein
MDKNTAELALIIYKNLVSIANKKNKSTLVLPHMLISMTSREQVELNR